LTGPGELAARTAIDDLLKQLQRVQNAGATRNPRFRGRPA
jgi:hypothetical protein